MNDPFLGMVQYFAFDFVPRGYAQCAGQLLAIQQNSALFALLGTYYGGNGVSTFALPDLRGRSVVGQSNTHTIGEKFGTTSVTLSTLNMPSHTHSAPSIPIPANSAAGDGPNPQNTYPAGFVAGGRGTAGSMYSASAGASQFMAAPSVTVANAGQGAPVSIQNPFLVVNACIATQGLFPSRN